MHFAERLARIGASGLVVGLGTGGAPVTPELAERVGQLELPLLTVPYSIRFSDIVRAVAEANDEHGSEQLGDVAQFYDLLRLSLASGDLGPATFESLGRRLGLRLHLVDAESGASVFDDQAVVPLGQMLARSVAEHGHAIPGLLRLSRDGSADGDVCALAVAVPGDPLTALIVEPLGRPAAWGRRAAARRDRRRGPARPDRLAAAAGAASGRRTARPASGSAPGLAGAEHPARRRRA